MGELNRRQKPSILPVVLLCLLTVCWMALIFWFSAQNSAVSGQFSTGLLQKILSRFVPGWKGMTAAERTVLISRFHTLFRKAGHFSEYFVLGILLSALLRIGGRHRDRSRQPGVLRTLLLPALLALCYAASDELHQKFVSGRSCELRDVCIDLSGACLGILIAALFAHFGRKRKRRRGSARAAG